LGKFLLYDVWWGWTTQGGVCEQNFGDAVESDEVGVAVFAFFELVLIAESECSIWTSDY